MSVEINHVDAEVFRSPLLGLHLKSMRYYGVIILKDSPLAKWHMARCIFLTASLVAATGLMMAKITFRGQVNMENSATSYATAFEYLTTTVMAVNTVAQRNRLANIVNFVHYDLTHMLKNADDIELNYFRRTVRYLRLITTILWAPSLLAGCMAYIDLFTRTVFMPETVFNVPQILNGTAQPILMFRLFPFGEIYDNFFVGYLGACYAMFLGITVIPLWHTFITCLMKFLTLKFEILSKRMRTMDISKISEKDVSLYSADEVNEWRLKLCSYCVKEQMKIRWFVKELEELLRIPVFMDFITFSLLICFLFFALTAGHPSNMDYFFMFIYLFVMGSILWLYHWHATLVAESNNALGFAIYSSEWFTYPLKLQKTIRLLMMDSLTPLKMRAILVELNLRTFIDIVRGAYSYFNILRNANAK